MERPQRVAAVILAAGEARRFGSPKQVAQLNGRTLLEHVLAAASGAKLYPIIAVVPPDLPHPTIASVAWIENPEPARGMSHSLRLGFAALPPDVGATVILLGDQPTIDPALIQRLIDARGSSPIAATRSAGLLTPPVLLERSHFAVVHDATGDIGLREILRRSSKLVTAVEVEEVLPDIDTRADLQAASGR